MFEQTFAHFMSFSLEENVFIMRLVGAILILFCGFIMGRILGLGLQRLLHELSLDAFMKTHWSYRYSFEKQLGTLLSIIIYAVTLVLLFVYLNLAKIILLSLALLIGILFFLSLLLTLRDVLPNVLTGIRLKSTHAFRKGDVLTIRAISGEVTKLGLWSTHLINDEELFVIPNRLFKKERFILEKKKIKG